MNRRLERTRMLVRAHLQMHGKKLPKRKRKIPPQRHPIKLSRKYSKQLQAVLSKDKVREAFAPLLARLPVILERSAKRHDGSAADAVGDGEQIRGLVALARQKMKQDIHPVAIDGLASDIFDETASYQKGELGRQIRSAFGVDVLASDSGLAARASDFVSANVSLIRDIPDRTADEIEKRVMVGLQTGDLWSDLSDDIEEQFGFGERRAKVIARDQVGKAFAAINQDRLTDLGIDSYIWRTSEDERVREEHEALDGEEFTFAEGSGPEGNPGDAVLCRCSAEPQLDSILSDDDESDDEDTQDDARESLDRADVEQIANDVVSRRPVAMGLRGLPGPPGPRGLRGDVGLPGVPGERGDAGPAGLDADMTGVNEAIASVQQRFDDALVKLSEYRTDAEHGGNILWGQPGETEGSEGDLLVTPICTTFRYLNGMWISTSLAGASGAGSGGGTPGPKGDKGDTGATGPAGPKGDTGVTGTAGTPGATGAAGAAGTAGATGATGAAGTNGTNGSNGANGFDGAPGSVWFTSSGAPSGATGVVGDLDLNTANGDVYKKTGASTWTLVANITGPAGVSTPPSGTGFVHVTGGAYDTRVDITGDVTIGASGVAAIGANKVLDTMLRTSAALSLVGRAGGTSGNVADIIASGDGQFPLTAGGSLAFADFPSQVAKVAPYFGFFGMGFDGSVTFDGTSTIAGFVPVGGRYVINRDVYFVDCTVNSGVVLVLSQNDNETINSPGVNAHRLFCNGTLTNNGRITNNGSLGANASATNRASGSPNFGSLSAGTGTGGANGSAAASPGPSNHIWTAAAAIAGGAATVAGTSATGFYRGGSGGGGGTGTGGTSGAINAMPSTAGGMYDVRPLTTGLTFTNVQIFFGGVGGGGGGGDGTNFGGAGGGAGGLTCCIIYGLEGTGTFEAIGRNGGNGVSGNTGGGGGGGGGSVVLPYAMSSQSAATILARCLVTGGTGGTGAGTGKAGGNGAPGKAFVLHA